MSPQEFAELKTKTARNKAVSKLTKALWMLRKERKTHPEGTFDRRSRWYPSTVEDADGDGSCTRSPSAAWPYSYMARCRTRQHCKVLVERYYDGQEVPFDMGRALQHAFPRSVYEHLLEMQVETEMTVKVSTSTPARRGVSVYEHLAAE